MGGENRREVNPELARARDRLFAWRRTKKPKSRIPEQLWELAVKLAAKHGLHCTAQTLKLDYYSLKKRVEATTTAAAATATATATTSRRERNPAFIDLPPALGPVREAVQEAVQESGQECVIAFENGAVNLQVHLKGYNATDVVAALRSVRGSE